MGDLRKEIAKKIKEIREANNLSVRELAIKMNVTDANIYSMEAGKGGYNIDTMDKFARALNCSIKDFYDFQNAYLTGDGGNVKDLDLNTDYNHLKKCDHTLDKRTCDIIDVLFKDFDSHKIVAVINYLIKKIIQTKS